jgi:class 3 adenylate cyclase
VACDNVQVGEGVHDDGFVVPSGTVTFLFTDVEGSTRLWAADSDGMSASLRTHDDIVRSLIQSLDGYVFGTAGDSFAAAFTLASKAIEATAELQAALASAAWPGPELRVRAGLHLGEAEQRDGDYFGPAVNTAARVSEAGHGGQTLLTEAVRVASRVKGTVDLGLHALRDVEEPIHIHQLAPGDFPDLRGEASNQAPASYGGLPRSWFVVVQPDRAPATVTLTSELTVGRDVGRTEVDGHLALQGDPTVSRLHAVLIPKPTGWCVQATNATNGLFVNGTRLAPGAVHLMAPEDEIRLGERTTLTFHTLVAATDDRSSTQTARSIPDLTPGERRVLLSLCSPVLGGDMFTPPATVQAIAAELVVTESAVKQQLGRLYTKFEVDEGPDRRVRLANEALGCGAVRLADLQSLRET